jgi:outer membrane protein OmpA-like peptidoglycan-associated protein
MRKFIRLSACLLLLPFAQTVFAQSGDNFGTPISTTVYVFFQDSSASFRPAQTDIETLTKAKSAALVAVRGRTSTIKPSAKDEAMALARATSARTYLIAHGVSPLKININYASAADYIAENSTPEGRLQNQRVEIEIVHVPRSNSLFDE